MMSIPEELVEEAKKQSKIALARTNAAHSWDDPAATSYSIINHPLLKEGQVIEVDMGYIGHKKQGTMRIRGS